MSNTLPKDDGLQRTVRYPLVHNHQHPLRETSVSSYRTEPRLPTVRDVEPDGLLEPMLDLRTHCGEERDTCLERDDLHRHVRAVLLLFQLLLCARAG
jgi:hypothetical protein